MQFVMLIYESPDAFASRNTEEYTGAWRAYHKALVESGVFVAGDPLEVPETGTTISVKEGKRGVQDGPYADTKEQLGDSRSWNCRRLMQQWSGQHAARRHPMVRWKFAHWHLNSSGGSWNE
jgi:hypothetical protein